MVESWPYVDVKYVWLIFIKIAVNITNINGFTLIEAYLKNNRYKFFFINYIYYFEQKSY